MQLYHELITAINFLSCKGDSCLPTAHNTKENYPGFYDKGNIVCLFFLPFSFLHLNTVDKEQRQQPIYQKCTATGEKMLADAFTSGRRHAGLWLCVEYSGDFKRCYCFKVHFLQPTRSLCSTINQLLVSFRHKIESNSPAPTGLSIKVLLMI